MNSPNVAKLTTNFFRGFSVDIDGFSIAGIYSNALKSIQDYGPEEAKANRRDLQKLFSQHGLVIGDLNSSPRALQLEIQLYGLSLEHFDKPTYLFPAPDNHSSVRIPCFDNAVWNPSMIDSVGYETIVELPEFYDGNPRDLIKARGLLSDHVPIKATLRKGELTCRVISHNVADPLLWSQYYPLAGNGFAPDIESDVVRQSALLEAICDYHKHSEIVFLQEVPFSLSKRIRESFPTAQMIDMQSELTVEYPSQIVVITRK